MEDSLVKKGIFAIGAIIGAFLGYNKGKNDACDSIGRKIDDIKDESWASDLNNVAKDITKKLF